MRIQAVIFDLDGTITRPYFDFDAIREEIGIDGDNRPVLEAMREMSTSQKRRAEQILHRHEQDAVRQSTLNPGARETIDGLRQRDIGVAVLTRNRKSNAVAVARKHGLHFDFIVGREEGPVKPDAFGVLHICNRLGIEPAETLLVGDFLFDLLCAKTAGAVAVLLKNANLSAAKAKNTAEFAEHADFVIENISRILQIIDNTQDR